MIVRRWALGMVVLAVIGGAVAACGDDGSPVASTSRAASSTQVTSSTQVRSTAPQTALADGPVTVVALGDSLTEGRGDDSGQGFVGRLADAIGRRTGRDGSTLVNLGRSGWDSTMMLQGGDGADGQLPQAVDEVRRARDDGRAVLATVLIGSNDLWYLYEYGPEEGTTAEAEDAAVATFRENLDRAVRELQAAGALVVVGLPDDQTRRSGVIDGRWLRESLPSTTAAEVGQMARLAERFDRTAEEIANDHGVVTVDTNASFWSDAAKMADDGAHPNEAGYADLADLWMNVLEAVL